MSFPIEKQDISSCFYAGCVENPITDDALRDLAATLFASKAVRSDFLEVTQQYTGTLLRDVCNGAHKLVLFKSPEGSGKTQAIKALADTLPDGHCILLVSHLVKLTAASARSLNNDKQIAVDYMRMKSGRKLPESTKIFTTTLHSAESVRNTAESAGFTVDYVIFDECESVAQTLASTIMSGSYAKFLNLVGYIRESKASVIMMDANLGDRTELMVGSYFAKLPTLRLTNSFKRWDGTTAYVIDGYGQGFDAVVAMIGAGKKVFVAVTSASKARSTHDGLAATGILDGLRVFAGYTDDNAPDSDEVRAVRDNPDLLYGYDVAIISPTMGTGISLDKPHFDTTVLFAVHDPDCPDYTGALQMLFRVRHPVDNAVTVVLVDQSSRGRPIPAMRLESDVAALIGQKKALMDINVSNSAIRDVILAGFIGYSNYRVGQAVVSERRYSEFSGALLASLAEKGLNVVHRHQEEQVHDVASLAREAKELRAVAARESIVLAADIDHATAADIAGRQSRGGEVTAEEANAKRKYDLLVAFHDPDTDAPTDVQIGEYLDMDADGVARGRNKVAKGLLSFDDIRVLEASKINDGAGSAGFDMYGDDDVAIRAEWKLMRALCHVAGIKADENFENCRIDGDTEVTAKSLKDVGHGFSGDAAIRHLRAAIADWNAVNAFDRNLHISLAKFNADPVKVTRDLIKAHLGLVTKANGKGSFIVPCTQPVIANFNMRRKSGLFGVLSKLARAQAGQMFSKDGAISEQVQKELGIDGDVVCFIRDNLKLIQVRRQPEVVAQYLRLARKPRIAGDNFSPVYYANTYLREYVEANASVIVESHHV